MIESVVEFSAKLQAELFLELEVLVDANIPVVEPRPAGGRQGAPNIAECERWRLSESRGVEPHVVPVHTRRDGARVTHQVGSLTTTKGVRVVRVGREDVGRTADRAVVRAQQLARLQHDAARIGRFRFGQRANDLDVLA